jgi:excisionase family DNA binding protein
MMPRTKGAKNKPRELKTYESLPDILTPAEAARWLRMSRSNLVKQIHSGEIPKDCYYMVGTHYKLIKSKLATLKGIRNHSEFEIVA